MRISDWSSDVCSSDLQTQWNPQPSLGVVMAAGGYPGAIRKGDVIRGLEADLGMAKVFHAGTTLRDDGAAITSGGRVLCAVARGAAVREAQRQAYAAVEQIRWDGVQYRRDIGYRPEDPTPELPSLMRSSYAVFCWQRKRTAEHKT